MDHLDENEIAAYVDAIIAEKTNELPKEILEHVEECLECKKAIMDVWDTLKIGNGKSGGLGI